ncbi:hypothetical protein [Salinibacterium sp. TMP30]|uniref:hypothetical protein n=1 Tax=Salinibacterium sp. TMP30 TaxID=3138237 RepID=UPI00313920A3
MMGTARIALIGVLAIAIVANILQFQSIDEAAPDNYEAISRKPSSDIVEIAGGNAAVNRAYGLYWAISEDQPAAEITMSANDEVAFVVTRFLTLGFAKAESFELSAISLSDETTLDSLLDSPDVSSVQTGLYDGHGHRSENWFYVRGTCDSADVPSLLIGHLPEDAGEAFVVVDSCLVPNSGVNG